MLLSACRTDASPNTGQVPSAHRNIHIQPSNLQLGKSSPPLENWQKSYQNGEYIRSAESGEEANYNMVDGLHNNRRKRKKGKKRRSVLKRLHEKQLEVARREKKLPQQECPQAVHEQEIERKQKK